ncbi:MAG: hypothetical protein VX835_04505 [Pseudomonadota bacterium]|nr:hypothetical protein [Pseudomonadota bacterium]
MLYTDLIISSSTVILSSLLIVDTLLRPKQIYQNWTRNRGIKKILRQFKNSKGHWIIVTGTEKSGKSTILRDNNWIHLKTVPIGNVTMHIWQFKDNALWALEMTLEDMGGISDQWWQCVKQLKAKRIYYFLTTEECRRFKAKHTSKIETHVIISHADKIQGFSPFMSDMSEKNMTLPIGSKQTKSYTIDYLQEAFETLYAQLQTYGNQLLNRISNPEVKKIINDFPQHCLNLQLGLNKVIVAMPVQQIYCYGQIWQNGTPKMLFTPPLASGLTVVTNKKYSWRKCLLAFTIALMVIQIVSFKFHLRDTWQKQPLEKITAAQSHIETLEKKQPFLKWLSKGIAPVFRLTNQQLDEASEIASNYAETLDAMTPIIAAIDIRQLNKQGKDNKILNNLLNDLLADKNIALQKVWNNATDEERFIASLHYAFGSKKLSDPLPNLITTTHIKTACSALTNRLSEEECLKHAKNWLQPDLKNIASFDELIKTLNSQTSDGKVKPLIDELITWLKQISNNPNKSFYAFEFLVKHNQKPESNHILSKLKAQEEAFPELKNIQLITWQLLLNEAGKYMNGIWQKTIYPYHTKQFSNSYPLVKESPQDATLNAFNQFYGVGGLINIYYNNYILPFVDSRVQTFKTVYPGTIFPIKDDNLNYFKAIAAVQTLLYQGDTSPHLEINLSPIYDNETWSIKTNEIAMNMNKPVIVGWPTGISQAGINIYEGKKKVSEHKGIWGFWRWFESGTFANNELAFSNHTFKISGQTESDLNWLIILRSQKPNPSLT